MEADIKTDSPGSKREDQCVRGEIHVLELLLMENG